VQTLRETAPPMPLQEPARPESQQSIGDAAVAAGVAQRMADGSVVFNGGAGASGATSIAVQREAAASAFATGSASEPVMTLQRAESTAAAATTTSAAPEAGAATDPAADEKKNDELAEKIYDRIKWKLHADLRAEQWRTNTGTWTKKGR